MKEYSIYELNQRQQYMMLMRPILHKHALFADGTKDYRNPPEPKENEEVTLTFRSAKNNVDIVWLRSDKGKIPMEKKETKYEYKVNFTMAAHICRVFLRLTTEKDQYNVIT